MKITEQKKPPLPPVAEAVLYYGTFLQATVRLRCRADS